MMSEWLKVMLEEIARKKAEVEQARQEERQRLADPTAREAPAAPADDAARAPSPRSRP